MKKILLIGSLLSSTCTAPALADDLVFTLINNSEYIIHEFYTASPDSDSWGDDILGDQTIEGGGTGTITLTGAGDQCEFDLKVVDQEKAEHELEAVNLCESKEVTFTK